jgi:predicted nucleotidyltransferase
VTATDDEPRSAARDIVESLRRMFEPCADKITAAFIFGSVARGTETPRSDVDLMIVGELDYDTVYDITDEAGLQLRKHVSPVLISLGN